jgi:hypothetical protein
MPCPMKMKQLSLKSTASGGELSGVCGAVLQAPARLVLVGSLGFILTAPYGDLRVRQRGELTKLTLFPVADWTGVRS